MAMLIAFDAVMTAGGFARAAEQLNLTPAAVSYQIKSLEKLLGAPLFERRADRVVPTALARELIAESTEILRRSRRFRDKGRARARRRTTVRVLAAQTLASLWLLPRFADLIATFADCDFEIISWLGGSRPTWIGAENSELHIEIRWARDKELLTAERPLLLAPDSALPVCAPRYLPSLGDATDPASWTQATILFPSSWPQVWDHWCKQAFGGAVDLPHKIVLQNSALCIQAAASGVGVAMAHGPLVTEELTSGRLVRPHGAVLKLAESYFAVDRTGAGSAIFPAFARWCRENMRAPDAADQSGDGVRAVS